MIILLTIPGLVLLSFLKGQCRESILNRGKWAFITGTSVVITTLVSIILLLLRSLNIYLIMGLYLIVGLARFLWIASKGESFPIKKLLPDLRSTWGIAIVLLIAVILYSRPAEYYVGGRDPGVYVNAAVHMAKTGQVMKKDPLIDHVKENYPGVFDVDSHKYAGFYLENRGGQTWINPQFYHGYTAWLALGYQWLGGNWFLYVTPLLGLISVLIVYSSVGELMKERIGLITAMLLVINISQIWYARGPYTEILSQLLLWFTIYLLIKTHKFKNPLLAAAAGLTIGVSILVRLDNILILLPLVLYILYNYLKDNKSVTWIKYVIASLALCAVIFFIYVYQYGREYTHYQLIGDTPLPDKLSLPMLFAILGALALAGLLLIWLCRKRLYSWLGWFEKHKKWWMLLLTVIAVVAFIYLYFIRPYIPSDHIKSGEVRMRSFREETLVRIGWYVTPLGLVLCLAGFILFVLKKASKKHLFFMLLVLLNFSIFLYDPRIYPDHFWAVRRHVPFIIPAMLVFAALVIDELISRKQKLIKALGLGLVAVLIINFALASRPFVFHTEYGGVDKQLEEIAEKFDDDDIILSIDTNYASRLIGTPLDLIYDKKVMPLRENYDVENLLRFIEDKQAEGRGIYFLLSSRDSNMAGQPFYLVYRDSIELSYNRAEVVHDRRPEKVFSHTWKVNIYEPAVGPISWEDGKLDVGNPEDINYRLEGFYGAESSGKEDYRWSGPRSLLEVALPEGYASQAKGLTIRGRHLLPPDVLTEKVEVIVNGQSIGSVDMGEEFEEYTLEMPENLLKGEDKLTIEFITKTWKPKELGMGEDTRDLGFMLDYIRIED